MWIMTTDGFYSAVQKHDSDPGTITVRARSRGDLLALLDVLAIDREVLERPGTDYPCRVLLTREEWGRYLADAVARLDYDNFKAAVSRGNRARAHTYSSVWHDLHEIENESD